MSETLLFRLSPLTEGLLHSDASADADDALSLTEAVGSAASAFLTLLPFFSCYATYCAGYFGGRNVWVAFFSEKDFEAGMRQNAEKAVRQLNLVGANASAILKKISNISN